MANLAYLPPAAAIRARYELKPHRSNSDARDGNGAVQDIGPKLRQYARHLDQNHDLIKGALDRLTQFIVGATGIGIEPQPRLTSGEVDAGFSAALLEAWRDWTQWPDVTWEHDWAACQRLLCRSWLRDGEVLINLVRGLRPDLDHGTRVPFSIELLEADYLPFNTSDASAKIVHGVERNAWNRPVAYWIYKQHPGGVARSDFALKRVASENLLHLKMTDRIGQVRGVSVLASILQRMNDIFEYENAERVAARIAASLTGALKTENPSIYTPPAADEAPRSFDLQPGMILDNLRPGESLDMFSSNRPSPTVESFRNGQLRAAAAGIGLSYSALSRDYNGTYSAQRQELVEQFDAYRILSNLFISQAVRPIWTEFVRLALVSGVVTLPPGIDPLTADDASFQPPTIPWIDPLKEAAAQKELLANYLTSPQALIRARGGNPDEVLNNWQRWHESLKARALTPKDAPKPTDQQRNPTT
ncbi:MAG: phage portal protein [Candidatus Competibacteraceae bacterium]